MKLYTTIDTHIVDHKSELVSVSRSLSHCRLPDDVVAEASPFFRSCVLSYQNATTLDSTASQLSSWGNHIVESVNIKGDGKQPSSSA